MSYGDYPDLSRVERVLVIKLRHLGDVLLTTPLLNVLHRALPRAAIDVCVYAEAAPLLEGNPRIRELLLYDRSWKRASWWRRWGREWHALCRVRKAHYDLVIQLTEGERGAWMSWISQASCRVGWAHGKHRFMYTHLAKNCPFLRHTVERQLDVLRRIGIFPHEEEKELFLPRSSSIAAELAQRIPFERFILVHPTSRWRFKCWPVANMKRLIRALIARGEKVVLSAGPCEQEQQMVAEIASELDTQSVLNLAGQLSLQELGELVARSQLLVSVDSLPFHMASALKKPVVALFGPTSEVTWGPWRNEKARVMTESLSCRPCYQDGCGGSKRSECLSQIPVEKVLKSIRELLYSDSDENDLTQQDSNRARPSPDCDFGAVRH